MRPSLLHRLRPRFQTQKVSAHSSWVVWPNSRKVQAWEAVVSLTLVYTVIVTPFQVAFMDHTPLVIFIFNRFVDCCLVIDVVLQMFLVYQKSETSSRSSGTYVTSLSTIRMNYLKTWFLCDFIGLMSSMAEIADITGNASTAKTTRFVQAVRFFRLFRLARPLQRARNAAVRMAGHLPIQVGFFASEFFAWLLKLVLVAHIVACVFGFAANVQDGRNWLKVLMSNKGLELEKDQPIQAYMLSLYWSYTILLTIGFGDVVPITVPEHIVCIVVMVVGGLSWTLLMATACSLAAAMDHERLQHGMNVETLVKMCSDHRLPKDLTSRLLHFLMKSRRMELLAGQQELMSKMSPSLQSEVAVHITERFLRKVDFLVNSENGFTVALASFLRLQIFPPKEWIVPHELATAVTVVSETVTWKSTSPALDRDRRSMEEGPAVVTRGYLHKRHCPHLTMLEGGIAVLEHFRCSGSCWHKDLILSGDILRDQEVAQSIVFCSVYLLSREVLFSAMQDSRFPIAKELVRQAAIKLALVRVVTRAARAVVAQKQKWSLQSASMEILNFRAESDNTKSEVKDQVRADLPLDLAVDTLLPVMGAKTNTVLPIIVKNLTDARQEIRGLAERQVVVERQLSQIISLLSAPGSRKPSPNFGHPVAFHPTRPQVQCPADCVDL